MPHLGAGDGEEPGVRRRLGLAGVLHDLDVPERVEVMQKLMDGEQIGLNGTSESARNIAARYDNIADHLPEEVTGAAPPILCRLAT